MKKHSNFSDEEIRFMAMTPGRAGGAVVVVVVV
jgi:hypothetical protein